MTDKDQDIIRNAMYILRKYNYAFEKFSDEELKEFLYSFDKCSKEEE